MKQIDENTTCEDLLKSVKKIFQHFYKRKYTGKKSYNYDGYKMHSSVGCCSSVEDMFTTEGIEYNKERGRQPFDLIILLAYQLGYSRAMVESDKKVNELRDMINLYTKLTE